MNRLLIGSISLASSSLVDMDFTVVLEVVIFFLLFFLLTFLLYRPVLSSLEARTSRTEGAREEARRRMEEADRLTREYEEKMREVRKETAQMAARLRQKAAADQEAFLGKARKESVLMLEEARSRLGEMEAEMHRALEPKVGEIARRLAAKFISSE